MKKVIIFVGCILIVVLILGVGFIAGISLKSEDKNVDSLEAETFPVIMAQICFSDENKDKTTYSSADMLSKEQKDICLNAINSSEVVEGVKEIYPSAKSVELLFSDNTSIAEVNYVCHNDNIAEGIEILERYVAVFSEYMWEKYSLKISIVTAPYVSEQ